MLGRKVTQSPRPQLPGLSSSPWAGEAGGRQPCTHRAQHSCKAQGQTLSILPLSPSSKASGPKPEGRVSFASLPRRQEWSALPMDHRSHHQPRPSAPASCTGLLQRSLNSPMAHLFPNHKATTQSGSRSKYRRLDDVACGSHITIHNTGLLPLFPDSLATLQCLPSGLGRSAHSNFFF